MGWCYVCHANLNYTRHRYDCHVGRNTYPSYMMPEEPSNYAGDRPTTAEHMTAWADGREDHKDEDEPRNFEYRGW